MHVTDGWTLVHSICHTNVCGIGIKWKKCGCVTFVLTDTYIIIIIIKNVLI